MFQRPPLNPLVSQPLYCLEVSVLSAISIKIYSARDIYNYINSVILSSTHHLPLIRWRQVMKTRVIFTPHIEPIPLILDDCYRRVTCFS